MSKQQDTLMSFDPATGEARPYPSHAQQWRNFHGADAWLWNPWTGERRAAGDVGSDPFGLLIVAPGEPIYAGQPAVEALGKALDAVVPASRVLAPTDAFCPSCGHNRDKSSVSSVDLGEGRKGCQMCGAEWVEPTAKE